MRHAVARLALVMLCTGSIAVAGDAPPLDSETDRTLYAMGLVLGRQVEQLQLSEEEFARLAAGLRAASLRESPAVSLDVYGPRIAEFAVERRREFIERNRAEGREFLSRVESDDGVWRGPSGWLARTVQEGSGPSAAEAAHVKVRYSATHTDGTVFESSDMVGGSTEVDLVHALPCWREAVATMSVGETARLYCPPDTAYGDKPHGSVPPGSTVVFELELLEILE